VEEALKLLGLGTPFVYATATYGLFKFLDEKASGAAKKAISEWFKPLPYNKTAVGTAVVELFDRLYTSPLLSFQALARSAFFTVFVAALFAIGFVLDEDIQIWVETTSVSHVFLNILPFILSNILTDYFSLFFIRRWLEVKGRNPLLVVFGGLVIGVIFILIINAVVTVIWLMVVDGITFAQAVAKYFDLAGGALEGILIGERFIVAAAGVHLWLLFLALGVIFLQLANLLLSATGKMQKFLKQGQHHPLEAIGFVAAVLVFVVAAVFRWVLGSA
jgi:hypothetical protein